MSESGRPNGAWDDARLDAAFQSAFVDAGRAGLDQRILAAIHATHPARWWAPTSLGPGLVAAAVVVAVLATTVAIGRLGPAGRGAPSPAAVGSGGATEVPDPAGSGAGLPWPFPDHVASGGRVLDVLTVDQAIQVRSTEGSPRSIAVAGWESEATESRFCPLALQGLLGRLENRCAYNVWLARVPQPTTTWYDPPILPALHFVWASEWSPDPDGIRFGGGHVPRGSGLAMVVVGHFHDPVSAQCRAEEREQCSSTFVVENIAWTLTSATFAQPPAGTALQPMSVAEAIQVHDEADSSVELAVGGWYVRNLVPCPPLPDAQAPLEDCINGFTWLMANPEELNVVASDGSGSVRAPNGPAISLVLDGLVAPQTSEPVYQIAVGHFHDPRASACPAGDRRAACGDRFVVDLVVQAPSAPSPAP